MQLILPWQWDWPQVHTAVKGVLGWTVKYIPDETLNTIKANQAKYYENKWRKNTITVWSRESKTWLEGNIAETQWESLMSNVQNHWSSVKVGQYCISFKLQFICANENQKCGSEQFICSDNDCKRMFWENPIFGKKDLS